MKEFIYKKPQNYERNQRMNNCIEFILSKEKGEIIDFKSLAEILEYDIEDEIKFTRFKQAMCKIKNVLINYGYIIKRISGVGYYILKSKQISGYCYHTYIEKTERLLEKSNTILANVKTEELSEIRMKEYAEVKELRKEVYEKIDNTINDSEYIKNKEKYDHLKD